MRIMTTLMLVLGLTPMALAQSDASRVGDFALLDHRGEFHRMSWYSDREAIVLLTHSSQCEFTGQAASSFSALAEQYGAHGFEFMVLNADGNRDRELLGQLAVAAGLELPILMDSSQLVSESLKVNYNNEAIVFSPKNLSVLYRGPLDDSLKSVLHNVDAGKPIITSVTSAVDSSRCAIEFATRDRHQESVPSYVADVAPILERNCANCHREGGIAPFAMDSHLMVKGWSPMIRETLLTKRMPPGQIDPHIGNFDALGLTVAETQTLVHWIDAGAPKDGTSDPLTQLSFADSRWPLGEPDMIIKVPPTEVPATGSVPYVWVDSGIVLEKGRWLRGSELMPGDPTVVHHVISVAVPPDMEGPTLGICPNPCESGDRDPNEDGIRLQGYVPGINPQLAGGDVGTFIDAGSRFVFQMHYTTSGKDTTDASELGLYFHPENFEPTERIVRAAALNNDFVIPPNQTSFPVSASFVVPMDATLTDFSPHMHVRGKSMKFTAKYPDGTAEALLSVPNYDFNWQRTFRLLEPKAIPAGTTIVVEGTFDNSSRNLANPAPQESIQWGDQSWEEMFIGFMTLQVSNGN